MDQYVLFECAVTLLLLGYVAFHCRNDLRRDNFRSDIRLIRDDLFDYMWKNNLDYSTSAYRQTRQTLNGLLRASNVISPIFFIISLIHLRNDDLSSKEDKCLESLSNKQLKSKILDTRDKAVRRLLKFVFLEGVPGFFVKFLCLGICSVLVAAGFKTKLKEWAFRKGNQTISEAYTLGEPILPGGQQLFART